jgi:hypothetical protein
MLVRRRVLLAVLFAGTVLALPSAVGQGTGATDRIRFRNPKKDYAEEVILGTVAESAGGLKVTLNNKSVVDIAAPNVVFVEYGSLPGLDKVKLDLNSAENQGAAGKARELYAAEVKKNPTDPRTKRFLEFREAYWTAKLADAKIGKEFESDAPAAIAKLVGFAQEYAKKNAWEVWTVSRTAARMNAELGKLSEAATIYSQLSKVDNLPADLKWEARVGEVEMLVRSGNALTTQPLVDELKKAAGFPKNGPVAEKLTVLAAVTKALAEKKAKTKPAAEVKVIEDVIASTTDPGVRAFGHNLLGELYLQCDLPREAMWELLRVEVVDNLDREEVIKAVWRLADCFQRQGDENRARTYREKLPSVKGA